MSGGRTVRLLLVDGSSSLWPASSSPAIASTAIANGSRDGDFVAFSSASKSKHRFTRPYTPRTDGKAERFIQTALRVWAYARSYQNSLDGNRTSTQMDG